MADQLRENDRVVATRELSSSVSKHAEGRVIRVHSDNTVTVRFDNGVERERLTDRDVVKKGSAAAAGGGGGGCLVLAGLALATAWAGTAMVRRMTVPAGNTVT